MCRGQLIGDLNCLITNEVSCLSESYPFHILQVLLVALLDLPQHLPVQLVLPHIAHFADLVGDDAC